MSQLSHLQNQLKSVRRKRANSRKASVITALLIAAIVALFTIFVLDYAFHLSVLQRLVVFAIAIVCWMWAFRTYASPLLGIRESETQVALMVERQQTLQSDLVAAMQFEGNGIGGTGSAQMEEAVVQHASSISKDLNVYEGMAAAPTGKRVLWCMILLAAAVGLCLMYPNFSGTFWNRLCLGSQHYPSKTQITQVHVNDTPVLDDTQANRLAPKETTAAQAQPVSFVLHCSGDLPSEATVQMAGIASGAKRKVELTQLTMEDRLENLNAAVAWLDSVGTPEAESARLPSETIDQIAVDSGSLSKSLASKQLTEEELAEAKSEASSIISQLSDADDTSAVYVGSLPRLVSSFEYEIIAGDAWTDPATLNIIPLPMVQLQRTVVLPGYAEQTLSRINKDLGRDSAVAEGSDVAFSLQSINGKKLSKAWVTITSLGQIEEVALVSQDDSKQRWTLPSGIEQLNNVTDQVALEFQVEDEDGLQLETPIRKSVRIRPDRSPHGTLSVVHQVVLPDATPVVSYRVQDDFAVASVKLEMQVERASRRATLEADEPSLDPDTNSDSQEAKSLSIYSGAPITGDSLPKSGEFTVSLSEFGLDKGDQLSLTLIVEDFRGERPGKAYRSASIALEVSDENGVLAAISEADEDSESRLTDIIKRQLGIGESP